MNGNEIKMDNFQDLLEVISILNFEKKVKDEPKQNFKKAVKVGDAPKKAVKTGDAPKRGVKGLKFTPKKLNHHGRTIHFTNVKNSFKKSQERKSRKGVKKQF